MKQPYMAKGAQTPSNQFKKDAKGACSSVGSRKISGDSTGQHSSGSLGTGSNFNEGFTQV